MKHMFNMCYKIPNVTLFISHIFKKIIIYVCMYELKGHSMNFTHEDQPVKTVA